MIDEGFIKSSVCNARDGKGDSILHEEEEKVNVGNERKALNSTCKKDGIVKTMKLRGHEC
jgi:hypothetical protein